MHWGPCCPACHRCRGWQLCRGAQPHAWLAAPQGAAGGTHDAGEARALRYVGACCPASAHHGTAASSATHAGAGLVGGLQMWAWTHALGGLQGHQCWRHGDRSSAPSAPVVTCVAMQRGQAWPPSPACLLGLRRGIRLRMQTLSMLAAHAAPWRFEADQACNGRNACRWQACGGRG